MHLEASLWMDAAGLRQRLYNSRKRRSDGYMHEITYRYATADDIEGLLQSRLDMLRVVNNLGQDYDFDQEFINSSREYFLNGDQITVLAMDNGKVTVPYYDAVQLEYPDLSELAERIGMRDGDAGMLCGADSIQVASSAAFGGMLRLLG